MAENLAFMPAAVVDRFGENMATQVWLFGVYVASVSLQELSPEMGKNNSENWKEACKTVVESACEITKLKR
eukprot:bmy_11917T0